MRLLIPTPVLDLREMVDTCAPSLRIIESDNTWDKLPHQASAEVSSVDAINSTPALYSLDVTQPHQSTCIGHDLQQSRKVCPREQLSLPGLLAQQPYRPEFGEVWSQLPNPLVHLVGRAPYPLPTLSRESFSPPDISSLSQLPQFPVNSQRDWQFINPQRAPPWPSLRDGTEEQQAPAGLSEAGTEITSVTHSTCLLKEKKGLTPEPSQEYPKGKKDDIARQLSELRGRIRELEQENLQLKAHGSRRLGAAQSFENTGLPTASQPMAQVNVPATVLHLTTTPSNQIQIKARSIDDLITFEVLPRFGCGICSQLFYEISELEEHACEQSQAKLYACARCFLRFRSSESAEAHLKWDRCTPMTSKPTLATPSPIEKEVNIFNSTPMFTNSTFWCHLCQIPFSKQSNFAWHLRDSHDQIPYACHDCSKGFKTKVELMKHEVNSHGRKPYSCDECPRRFNGPSGVWNHKRRCHNKEIH